MISGTIVVMRTIFLALSLATTGLVIAGCECGGPDPEPIDGSDVDGGDEIDAEVPDGATCTIAGLACASDIDCCTGLQCADVGGTNVCTGTACGNDGDPCTIGADCCSLGCSGGTCSAGTACAPIGESCAGNGDCCSFTCTGGTCADNPASSCEPVGEACAARTECCSDRCAAPDGEPCAAGTDCRCAGAAACRSAGDLCTNDAQCCIGMCDRPGGAEVGVCAASGSCGVAGQPCGTEGFSGSCCSTACLDVLGTGTATCQPLGGCRVQDEPCRGDGDCCSGVCEAAGTTADGRPILRCANADSCIPAGEVCGGAGATSNCCPNGGGDTGCEPATTGVSRCLGGDGTCTLPGRECTMTSDCCTDAYPEIMCAPGRTGANVCCLADGAECDFGDTCCGGICAPDASGVLRCGATCVPDAMPCTAAADCCGCACVPDGTGSMVCSSDPEVCSPCTGAQLGESCLTDTDCCNNPAVICNEETALEFASCVLAP